jgi:hypothetical protein
VNRFQVSLKDPRQASPRFQHSRRDRIAVDRCENAS